VTWVFSECAIAVWRRILGSRKGLPGPQILTRAGKADRAAKMVFVPQAFLETWPIPSSTQGLHGVNRRLKEALGKASDYPVSPGTARPVPGKVTTE
jgi:hypothetical protein